MRVGDHAFGLLLRGDHDCLLPDQPGLLEARPFDEALGLAAGLRQQLLPVAHDPTGLLDLLRQLLPHRRDQLEELLAVQQRRRGQGHGLGLLDHVLDLLHSGCEIHSPTSLTLFVEPFHEAFLHVRRHQTLDVAAQPGDLLDSDEDR